MMHLEHRQPCRLLLSLRDASRAPETPPESRVIARVEPAHGWHV